MTEPLYRVTIALGDDGPYAPRQSWTLDHDPAGGLVTDGLHVLDGLSTGWSAPESPIGPLLQPNPMTAALAITVPDLSEADAPWMGEGSPVAITVALLGTVKCRFYGRLTDASATPRPGRTGVTLSIIAVDYTVDPGEWNGVIDSGPVAAIDRDVLESLFETSSTLGDFPPWHTTPAAAYSTEFVNVPATIAEMLFSTAAPGPGVPGGWGPTTGVRQIFAPLIDPTTGTPPTVGPRWAFDLLWNDQPAPRLVVDANRVERSSLTLVRNKATQPTILTLTGRAILEDPVPTATGTTPFGARPWGPEVALELNTPSADSDRVADNLAYYLPSRPERGWRIPTLRWQLTRERDDDDLAAVLADLPDNLFPRWDLDDADPDRAAYYQRRVEVLNVPDDINPYADDAHPEIVAPLAGVDLTIAGGHIALDLTLRHLQDPT